MTRRPRDGAMTRRPRDDVIARWRDGAMTRPRDAATARYRLRAKDEQIKQLRVECEDASATRAKAKRLFDDIMGKVKLNVEHQLKLEHKVPTSWIVPSVEWWW